MNTLTEMEKHEIEQKQSLIEEKATLLKEYKSYEQNLEFAEDDFEKHLIEQKREELAVQIKALGNKIRSIEALESSAASL